METDDILLTHPKKISKLDHSSTYLLNPCEIGFFIESNVQSLIAYLSAHLNSESTSTEIFDNYVDTSDCELFQSNRSLRIRSYPQHPMNNIDLILASWEPAILNGERFKADNVTVLSVELNQSIDAEKILTQYEESGFEKVLQVRKRRTTFDLVNSEYKEGKKCNVDFSEAGELDSPQSIFECTNHGLRILIDEFECSDYQWPPVLEIEFDDRLKRIAFEISDRIEAQQEVQLRRKEYNKITYAMKGLLDVTVNRVRGPTYSDKSRIETQRDGKDSVFSTTKKPSISKNELNQQVFAPGFRQQIFEEWKRIAEPKHGAVKTKSPGRLHFGIWNYDKLKIGVPGGGGLGLSTSISECVVTVKLKSNQKTLLHTNTSGQHWAMLFCKLVGFDHKLISVDVQKKIEPAHIGLGSNVVLNTSILKSLNIMFGEPFTDLELCEIEKFNYVETAGKLLLEKGCDSGLGAPATLFGGLVVVDESGSFVDSISTDSLFVVVVITVNPAISSVSERDSSDLRSIWEARKNDLQDVYRNQLLPAIELKDLEECLIAARECNEIWFKEFGAYVHGRSFINHFEKMAFNSGALLAGMTSEGPSVYAIMEDRSKAEEFAVQVRNSFGGMIKETMIGKTGRRSESQIQT